MISILRKRSLAENVSDSNQISVDLLITDAKLALTFLDLAETTEIAEHKSRRIEEAHKIYRSILSSLRRLSPAVEQKEILSKDLKTLGARLRKAGVPNRRC